MLDPRNYNSMSSYVRDIHDHQGSLAVPRNLNTGEMEWEYYVSKLHWNYVRSTPEDLETIKKIANRIS